MSALAEENVQRRKMEKVTEYCAWCNPFVKFYV